MKYKTEILNYNQYRTNIHKAEIPKLYKPEF